MNEKWVDFFVRQEIGKYFARIDDAYLTNTFNLYDLQKKLENHDVCYLLRKRRCDLEDYKKKNNDMESDMMKAYGLLHARYILTLHGLEAMYKNYIQEGLFPKCPRAFCKNSVCLPYGMSENLGESLVKMYCPNCGDVYNIDNDLLIAHLDGAFFGNSWIHLFLQKYADVIPRESVRRVYVPRIAGFKLYRTSPSEDEDDVCDYYSD